MISKQTAAAFAWGDNCEGWTLVSDGRLHVIQERMPPQTQELRHLHQQTRQFYYVLAGEGLVEIPPGVPHQLRNPSQAALEFLVISSAPPRNDRRDLEPRG